MVKVSHFKIAFDDTKKNGPNLCSSQSVTCHLPYVTDITIEKIAYETLIVTIVGGHCPFKSFYCRLICNQSF